MVQVREAAWAMSSDGLMSLVQPHAVAGMTPTTASSRVEGELAPSTPGSEAR